MSPSITSTSYETRKFPCFQRIFVELIFSEHNTEIFKRTRKRGRRATFMTQKEHTRCRTPGRIPYFSQSEIYKSYIDITKRQSSYIMYEILFTLSFRTICIAKLDAQRTKVECPEDNIFPLDSVSQHTGALARKRRGVD